MSAQHCMYIDKPIIHTGKSFAKMVTKTTPFDKKGDWARFTTDTELEDVKALPITCKIPEVGTDISYMGYPSPLKKVYGTGAVTHIPSEKDNYDRGLDAAEVFFDTAAAPGASGSPVMNKETGEVFGILTMGVNSRVGFFMIGGEGIPCQDGKEDQLEKADVDAAYDF